MVLLTVTDSRINMWPEPGQKLQTQDFGWSSQERVTVPWCCCSVRTWSCRCGSILTASWEWVQCRRKRWKGKRSDLSQALDPTSPLEFSMTKALSYPFSLSSWSWTSVAHNQRWNSALSREESRQGSSGGRWCYMAIPSLTSHEGNPFPSLLSGSWTLARMRSI